MSNVIVSKAVKDSSIGYFASQAYFICETAADNASKVAESSDSSLIFTNSSLDIGLVIHVKFVNANTAASPTLAVGTSTAKSISGSAAWKAGQIVTFIYDNNTWVEENNSANGADIPLISTYTGQDTSAVFTAIIDEGTAAQRMYRLPESAIQYVRATDHVKFIQGVLESKRLLNVRSVGYGFPPQALGLGIKTPIKLDSNNVPVDELFQVNFSLGFKLHGMFIKPDNDIVSAEIYFNISYNTSTGWGLTYQNLADFNYPVVLCKFSNGYLAIVVGAFTEDTYDVNGMFSDRGAEVLQLDYILNNYQASEGIGSGTPFSNALEDESKWAAGYMPSNDRTWEQYFAAQFSSLYIVGKDLSPKNVYKNLRTNYIQYLDIDLSPSCASCSRDVVDFSKYCYNWATVPLGDLPSKARIQQISIGPSAEDAVHAIEYPTRDDYPVDLFFSLAHNAVVEADYNVYTFINTTKNRIASFDIIPITNTFSLSIVSALTPAWFNGTLGEPQGTNNNTKHVSIRIWYTIDE